MSRIGRKEITVPAGVTVTLNGHVITVKGPKGTLERELSRSMIVTVEGNTISVARPDDDKMNRSIQFWKIQGDGSPPQAAKLQLLFMRQQWYHSFF